MMYVPPIRYKPIEMLWGEDLKSDVYMLEIIEEFGESNVSAFVLKNKFNLGTDNKHSDFILNVDFDVAMYIIEYDKIWVHLMSHKDFSYIGIDVYDDKYRSIGYRSYTIDPDYVSVSKLDTCPNGCYIDYVVDLMFSNMILDLVYLIDDIKKYANKMGKEMHQTVLHYNSRVFDYVLDSLRSITIERMLSRRYDHWYITITDDMSFYEATNLIKIPLTFHLLQVG